MKEVAQATQGIDEKIDLNKFSEADFERIYRENNDKFFAPNEIEQKIMQDNKPFKLDKINKIMIITTIAIVSILTVFTFIWGIM